MPTHAEELLRLTNLVHVDFNLTNACNLACTHCHSASGRALPDELTTEEIIDAVGQAHELGAMSIAFAGGEPFMRRDLLEVLKAASELPGWRVSVITNGVFLSDANIRALVENCPDIGLNVSIDGSNPTNFGLLRAQPGATDAARAALFARVVDGTRRAAAAGLHVSVNTTMTKATSGDLLNTYRLATAELGAKALVAIKFFPAGYGREHLDLYDFTWPLWSDFFVDLTRKRISGDIPLMQLSVPAAWEFYLPLVNARIDLVEAETAWKYRSPLREPAYAKERQLGDVAGWAELCISGDGSVFPSVLMVGVETQKCGSLRENRLADIWSNASVLGNLRTMHVSDIGRPCVGCGLESLCGGGSRSRAFADSGQVDGPDLACPIVSNTRLAVASL